MAPVMTQFTKYFILLFQILVGGKAGVPLQSRSTSPAQGAMAPDATDLAEDTPNTDPRDDGTGWEIEDT